MVSTSATRDDKSQHRQRSRKQRRHGFWFTPEVLAERPDIPLMMVGTAGTITVRHTLRPDIEPMMEIGRGTLNPLHELASDVFTPMVSWERRLPKENLHPDIEELTGQLEMLPSEEDVSVILPQLEKDDLRDFAIGVMNVAVSGVRRDGTDLETIRELNNWFATAEEIVAAGDDLDEIFSRASE